MLIDDITISIAGGHGGKGAVAFNKVPRSLGPAGGDGGRGGSVYFEGVSDLGVLNSYRHKKSLVAEDGQNGKAQFNDGHAGADIVLAVPIGTVIHNLDTGTSQEVLHVGERILGAAGGNGGWGNFKFRSSKTTTPTQSKPGEPGESFMVRLELKMIADVGFIGFPNAGKSSLLNELTAANSKVANYAFTTLEPNLGVYYDLVLADIPGLIEGASEGKGLGVKFLRHIERTRILFHFISAESEDVVKDYRTIRTELANYSETLAGKEEYVFLSKCDMVSPDELKTKLAQLKKIKVKAVPLTVYDDASVAEVKKILNIIAEKKMKGNGAEK